MELTQIIKDIKTYIESFHEVTAFQVMAEKGYSYLDARNTLELCVQEGMLVRNGDNYVVVQKSKRVSLKEQMNRKARRILDALSEEEIEFLKDATERRTISMMEKYCEEEATDFLRYIKHFLQLHLFVGKRGNYKLALSESEYLHMWKILGEYPKNKKGKSQTNDSTVLNEDDEEEPSEERIREARIALERRKAEILRRLQEEEEDDEEEGEEDDEEDEEDLNNEDDVWYDKNSCAIAEIRRHMIENKSHSRAELIGDITETISNTSMPFRISYLEKAILNLAMISDEEFERIKKQFCG